MKPLPAWALALYSVSLLYGLACVCIGIDNNATGICIGAGFAGVAWWCESRLWANEREKSK